MRNSAKINGILGHFDSWEFNVVNCVNQSMYPLGRYICQQLMDTHDDINLIEECNEREFGGDFDKIMSEEFSEEQTQYYSDADQPINDALNELGLFW